MLKCANLKKKHWGGGESNIEGAELSIGGSRATPKVYKLTPVSRGLPAHVALSFKNVKIELPS